MAVMHPDQPATPLRSPALGGSDIGRCLTRIHHDRFTVARRVHDDVRARAMADGIAFEAKALDEVTGLADAATVIAPGDDAVTDTLTALTRGDRLVLGARLTSDDGTLVGYPDLLVRLDDGYAPVDVKNHKVIGDSGPAGTWTPLEHIDDLTGNEVRFRSFRRRDLLQVAHYRRLLEHRGMASTATVGGVIGTDEPIGCVWVDLAAGDAPILDDRDAYVTAARIAIDHGLAGNREPLHDAWLRGECRRCDWHDWCMAELVAVDDPTLLRGVDAGLRTELAADGIATIAAVADLAPDDERIGDGSVVYQARALSAGSLLSQVATGAMDLPSAQTEVDFDIETYRGTTYLAGLLITRDGQSTYEPVVDWRASPEGERSVLEELFARFAAWSEHDVVVYHWTDYESRTLGAAADRYGLTVPGYATVEDWFEAHAVDLCEWCRQHLVSPNGFSLKTIAPLCGFAWRDDDPGGLQSEIWFERLHAGERDMAERLLAYNEDDVAAQLAVRRWIRDRDDGRGPGSAIDSVVEWGHRKPS